MEPGKNIGIIAAQSIASSLTQSVLNQFHSCGSNIKVITKGVPRLLQLLNMKQKSDVVFTIHGRDLTRRQFESKRLGDLLESYHLSSRPPDWVAHYNPSVNQAGLVVKLDYKKMYSLKLFIPNLPCNYIVNPFFELFLFGADLDHLEFEQLPTILGITLCGVAGVHSVVVDENTILAAADYTPHMFKRLLLTPNVDMYKTMSNNIWDIFTIFGIEAARHFLFKELCEILDPNLNRIHVELLVNQITWSGQPQSVSRYSLREDSAAVFTKASFEESMLNFLNAAFNQDTDHLTEVSSTIICGKRTRTGTGFFDLLFFG